mgnify:CR=1 FL=1
MLISFSKLISIPKNSITLFGKNIIELLDMEYVYVFTPINKVQFEVEKSQTLEIQRC